MMTPNGEIREKINTSKLSRDHVLEYNQQSGLVSIMGGKWTTSRLMAQDTLDRVVGHLSDQQLLPQDQLDKIDTQATKYLRLMGDFRKRVSSKYGYKKTQDHIEYNNAYNVLLSRKFPDQQPNFIFYLVQQYGRRADDILLKIKQDKTLGKPLLKNYPLCRAEIQMILQQEMVVSPLDILLRRNRVAFNDSQSGASLLPFVIEEMAEIHGWDSSTKKQIYESELENYEMMAFTSHKTLDQTQNIENSPQQ